MTTIDKICALLSIPIGAFFLLIGAFGFFLGSKAYFDLPPVLGFLPFLLGWSMCVTLIRFWRRSSADPRMATNNELHSGLFAKFLRTHPEFISADPYLQRKAYYRWIDSLGRNKE